MTSVLLAVLCPWAMSVHAQQTGEARAPVGQKPAGVGAARIPESRIAALEARLARRSDGESAVRRRLACKSFVREAEAVMEAYPVAPNRYRVLGLILAAQKRLLGLGNSQRNRNALFETCGKLMEAPDEYANLRLDADLLLTEKKLASENATTEARAGALRTLLTRYRDTPAEVRSLMITAVIAQKLGDAKLQEDILRTMAQRFAGNPKVIEFRRTRLDNRMLAAAFCGAYKRVDGTDLCFPMDRMGESTLVFFWSMQNDDLELRVEQWKALQQQYPGLFKMYSFNLDNLPDAGEKILRKFGVDWTAMRLPGGRDSQTYRAYARKDPVCVHVSPTGYAVLLPKSYWGQQGGSYARRVRSYLQKNTRFLSQLQSLFIGEFLVVHPCEPFDPALPPELKVIFPDNSNKRSATGLPRPATSLPEEELRAIQACFVVPPLRYRLTHEQAWANYRKAASLCSQTIERHRQAPDLWIVRNRRTIALLGLWKLSSEPKYLELAVHEARASLALKPPLGARIVPHFCLAKEALRHDNAVAKSVLAEFLEATGGPRAPGAAHAAAAILSLDACAPYLHAKYRRALIETHAEDPMAWAVLSFVLDPVHNFYLYRAPFYFGHLPEYRRSRKLATPRPEAAVRVLKADLKTLDGRTIRLPADQAGKWTVVLFMAPWEAGAGKSQERFLKSIAAIAKNPLHDIDVIAAFLDDDVKKATDLIGENPWECRPAVVPGGVRNPVVNRLGMLSVDAQPNVVLLRPDGAIGATLSGLTPTGAVFKAVQNSIDAYDEEIVDRALKNGDLAEARRLAFKTAPVDSDRKKISLPHLRSRARLYVAVKDWSAALADTEEVVRRQEQADGRTQIKSPELVKAIRLRAEVFDGLGQPERAREDRQLAQELEKLVNDDW